MAPYARKVSRSQAPAIKKHPAAKNFKTNKKILKDLKKAVQELSSFNESGRNCGDFQPEVMMQLEDIYDTFTKALGKHDENETPFSNEVLQNFSKYYVHRDGTKQVELLAPVEAFQATRSVDRKTFGFIRKKGQDFPLKYAISGPTRSLRDNSKVLDNEEWTGISLAYGKRSDFESWPNGLDHHHGHEKGTGFASHTERLLMLWFAVEMLRAYEKDGKPIERLLKRLHFLNNLRPQITAEILINREPCKNCRDFKEMLETVTGLKFKFILIPTLGNLVLRRDKSGSAFFPLKSAQVLEDEEDFDILHQKSNGSICQVIIPVSSEGPSIKATAPEITKHHHKQRHRHDEKSSLFSVETHVTISKSRKLVQSYAYQMSSANLEAGRQRAQFLEEPEGDDDEDFVPRTPIKLLSSQTRKSTRCGLATPNTTPLFAPEAHLAAKRIRDEKKRRLKDGDGSPSAGRKNKRTKKD